MKMSNSTLLIDLPSGIPVEEYLARIRKSGANPPWRLALTHIGEDPLRGTSPLRRTSAYDRKEKRWYRSETPQELDPIVPKIKDFLKAGITDIFATPMVRKRLLSLLPELTSSFVKSMSRVTSLDDAGRSVEFLIFDEAIESGAGAVYLKKEKVLFGGPLVLNGIRVSPVGRDTVAWIQALKQLQDLKPLRVVPGFGSWSGEGIIGRLLSLTLELRDQLAHGIAEGFSLAEMQDRVRIPYRLLYWTTHTRPRKEEIAHVYQELTVPESPFYGEPPKSSDSRPHALVLIGDSPHPPAPIEEALRRVFEATGVIPHFTVDVEALAAENLSRVQLLVMLRDGRQVERKGAGRVPLRSMVDPLHGNIKTWMTLDQEEAIVNFVQSGGAFLNLHNSLGLYPPNGPYLNLVGGRYIGHGPFERFRIEVVDPNHPITRGVKDFTTADEQHTPVLYDESQVHMILESRMDNGTVVPAGWVREVGRGKVCHLASGHPREPLFHPMYQRLMANAVTWCLARP